MSWGYYNTYIADCNLDSYCTYVPNMTHTVTSYNMFALRTHQVLQGSSFGISSPMSYAVPFTTHLQLGQHSSSLAIGSMITHQLSQGSPEGISSPTSYFTPSLS